MSLRVVWSRELAGEDAREYDAFVDRNSSAAYTQERTYATLACAGRAFSPRFFVAKDGDRVVGSALVLRATGPLGVKLPAAIVERGPVCALSDLEQVLLALRQKTLSRGIARLAVMPYFADGDAEDAEEILALCKFQRTHDFSSAHARTLRIDLRGKSAADVFAGKDGKTVRQEVRNAEKAGAKTRRGTKDDVKILARMHGAMMHTQKLHEKSMRFFHALETRIAEEPERCALFLTELGEDVVSIAYVARHAALTTYVMGASSSEERSFTKAAPAVAAAVEWARELGCDAFDLGGIPLEGDPDEKRRSIAAFKFKFAKIPVSLVREYARWF